MYTCLIPARGGSKSIPLKNIVEVNGKPLIWWTLKAANDSIIDEIFVSTDSNEIRNVVEGFNFEKVKVIDRSPETSTDEASTESVMSEFYDNYKPDNFILIQATSPLLKTEHINEAIDEFITNDYDSLLTLVRNYQFLWTVNKWLCAPNYNINKRPRRQDYDGYMVENGAFYITTGEAFNRSKCRLSGVIGHYEMPSYTLYEIDEEYDIEIISKLLEKYG